MSQPLEESGPLSGVCRYLRHPYSLSRSLSLSLSSPRLDFPSGEHSHSPSAAYNYSMTRTWTPASAYLIRTWYLLIYILPPNFRFTLSRP